MSDLKNSPLFKIRYLTLNPGKVNTTLSLKKRLKRHKRKSLIRKMMRRAYIFKYVNSVHKKMESK